MIIVNIVFKVLIITLRSALIVFRGRMILSQLRLNMYVSKIRALCMITKSFILSPFGLLWNCLFIEAFVKHSSS